jgi:tetratricopeptide (TPR) repeat protein
MTRKNSALTIIIVFVLGVAAGSLAAKKGIDASLYQGKEKKEAGKALLTVARGQAGKGSWERIGVGRIYYLGGMKAEGQAIFDEVTSKKAEPTDWWRIGRVYWEAGEWDKAREAFDKSLAKNPKDDKGLAELGAYYLLKGDRAKAEELFGRSFQIESGEVWNTSMVAGAYLGVKPQE